MRAISTLIFLLFSNFTFAQWVFKSDGLPAYSAMEGIVIGNPMYLSSIHHGVFQSVNKGDTWETCNAGLPTTNIRTITKSGLMYACTGGKGLYYYDTRSKTWFPDNKGIENAWVYSHVSTSIGAYAGTDYGMFFQTAFLGSWVKIFDRYINSLLSEGEKVYAGTNTGLYSKVSSSVDWSKEPGIAQTVNVTSLYKFKNKLWAGTDTGLFVLNPSETNWHMVYPLTKPYDAITSLTGADKFLVVGTFYGLRISSDEGLTWSDFNQNLSSSSNGSLSVDELYFYAGTYKDLGFARRPLTELDLISSLPSASKQEDFKIINSGNKLLISLNNSEKGHISVWDLNNREVFRTALISGDSTVSLKELTAGIYILKIITEDKLYSKKIFIE